MPAPVPPIFKTRKDELEWYKKQLRQQSIMMGIVFGATAIALIIFIAGG